MKTLQRWPLRREVELTLRAARTDDAAALGALIESLPAHDRMLRFHGAVNGLADAALRRWTGADGEREVALVVVARDGHAESLVADARYSRDAAGDAAEFALVVAPGWRRSGLGTRCMQSLRAAARNTGVRWLYGSVLAENAPMLALMRRCGFVVARSRARRGLMVVEARVDLPRTTNAERLSLRASVAPNLRALGWRVATA